MQIQYFAENQNIVFVPALFALLGATVLVCLPIVFVQSLRRAKRLRAVAVVAGALAVVALVGTAWFAGTGFRALGDERAAVRTWIASTYGLRLDAGQVGELVDGGKPRRTLPSQAAAAGLEDPGKAKTLKLAPTSTGADTYRLLIGGRPFPTVS